MSDTNSSPIFDQVASTDGNPTDDNTNTTDAQPVEDQSATAPETPEETQDAAPDAQPATDDSASSDPTVDSGTADDDSDGSVDTPVDSSGDTSDSVPDSTDQPDVSTGDTSAATDPDATPDDAVQTPPVQTDIFSTFVPKLENYQAVQLTSDNIVDASSWSGGTQIKQNGRTGLRIRSNDGYFLVGYPGDYVVNSDPDGFRVFDRALFESLFTKDAQ